MTRKMSQEEKIRLLIGSIESFPPARTSPRAPVKLYDKAAPESFESIDEILIREGRKQCGQTSQDG